MTGLQPIGPTYRRQKIIQLGYASLVMLVNHTPLGRVKTCVIFPSLLDASALTSA